MAFWFSGLLVESGLLLWPFGVIFCYGLLAWPSGVVAFWCGGLLLWPSGMAFWWDLLVWWPSGVVPSVMAFWYDLLVTPSGVVAFCYGLLVERVSVRRDPPNRWLLLWTVRILLECILVLLRHVHVMKWRNLTASIRPFIEIVVPRSNLFHIHAVFSKRFAK